MNEKLKTLRILHMAICAGTIAAYIFAGNFSRDQLLIKHVDTSEIIFIAIPVLAIFLSNFLFKSQLKQANPNSKIEANMDIYQAASLIRWAILEGAAFIILFIKPEFISFGILLIAYLISLRPTEDRIKNDLQAF